MTKESLGQPFFKNKKIVNNSYKPGNLFEEEFEDALSGSFSLDIISGYVDSYAAKKYGQRLVDISNNGRVRVMIGMAEKEGLAKSTFEAWESVDQELRKNNNGSGVYSPTTKIHSKVYTFNQGNKVRSFIGSSNFSLSGLKTNIESVVEVDDIDSNIIQEVDTFFHDSLIIDFKDIQIKNSSNYKKRRERKSLDELLTHKQQISDLDLAKMDLVKVDLVKFAEPERYKSSLNLFHSSGRVTNGVYTPRPWYEAELTIGEKNYPDLPQNFEVRTDDGYIFNMKRSGGGIKGKPETALKNLASTPTRKIFGEWFKRKLEEKEVLEENELITTETLENYGKNSLDFYKIKEDLYYLIF